MKPTLLVLAAGMGSRYGGLKQVDPIGPSGETIIDYSIFDAIKAGFGKIVFVIREQFEADFKKRFVEKLEGKIELEFVNQEIFKVPEGAVYTPEREKPWGTGHAILMAKDCIKEPFAVINADDFYGASAFKTMADFLKDGASEKENCMLAYFLKNTISENGSVSRGICTANENDHLLTVVERTHIEKLPEHIAYLEDEKWYPLADESTVSMNFWGFTPNVFEHLNTQFKTFLAKSGSELKSEFYIPSVVAELIDQDETQFKVLRSDSQWFGVTYKEDKEKAVQAIKQLIDKGEYPNNLWS
ncbi:nucleotidyltransferase family protein [Marinifilum caeruleilacunae]|uniref:Nucleotidyltransferase n=1 Tax=Marinifilum caeruleilacunae TaxID=2499076 RepID=A0ABX1WUH2_9BACT|nr:sugar phosphate nucleotidyltransferase [Marinifilum caeruleilacunae]NOU59739.1 nucleotidyltransferase [Marinifilum caeruleilacunae]